MFSKSEQQPSTTSAPSRLEDGPVRSNREPLEKPIRIRIKFPNSGNHEEKESTNLSVDDEQSKASEPSRFECEPVTTCSESADNTIAMELDFMDTGKQKEEAPTDLLYGTEEFIEESATSEAKEIDKHDGSIENITSENIHACKLCQKSFRSNKALYGHMRLHSKKEVKKEVKDEVSSNPCMPWHHILKWEITGRRGRKRKHSVDPVTDAEVVNCAHNLLYLYSGAKESKRSCMEVENTNRDTTNLDAGLEKTDGFKDLTQNTIELQVGDNTQEVKSSIDQNTEFEITLRFTKVPENDVKLIVGNNEEIIEITTTKATEITTRDAFELADKDTKATEITTWDAFELADKDNENTRTSVTQDNEKCITSLNFGTMETSSETPKAKKLKLAHSNSSDPTDGKGSHVCHICNKSFSTHQALGGHTSSHNKGKYKEGEGGDQIPKRAKKKIGDNEHRCKICGSVYLTGQSLGGHMRAHYEPGKDKNSAIKMKETDQFQGTVKENTGKVSSKSCYADAMETEQSQTVKEDTGKVFSESSSENAIEEIKHSQTVKEDTGKVFSEASSANDMDEPDQSKTFEEDIGKDFGRLSSATGKTNKESTRSALDFDLNELPDIQ